MTSLIRQEAMLLRPATLLVGFMLSLCAPLAVAQNNLGELLDAGAKRLSVEEFKLEVVQHLIVGPTASGSSLELIYTTNGQVSGKALSAAGQVNTGTIDGDWKVDDSGRVCTAMRVLGSSQLALPARCQFLFKYKDAYFFVDSDTDRGARVLRRTVKQ
jgi:hypothetical protein